MSYADRLQSLVYTSPSGKSFTLRYTEVSRERGKKAPVSEFPNQNQGAVQDLGQTTPRYPVSCFIDGENYDLQADRFWTALNEPGPGQLQHPRYGTIAVLPVTISQSESLIDGAGRATFEIEFIRSDEIALEYPRTGAQSAASVGAAVDDAGAAIGETLADVEVEEPGLLATLKAGTLAGLAATRNAFNKITGVTESVRTSISSAIQTITNEIDTLIAAPANLTASLLSLYRLPADTVTDVKAKIDGYTALIETIATAAVNTTTRYGELFGLIGAADVNAATIASAEATTSGTFTTRADAVDSALALRAIADRQAAAMESIGNIDYESYLATRRALTIALNALIANTLTLPAERVYATPRDMTPLELVFELYGVDGDADVLIDRIIGYNNLTGDEILLIPSGTEVRWYV